MKQNKQTTRQTGNHVSKMMAKVLAISAPICALAAEEAQAEKEPTVERSGTSKVLVGACLVAAAGIVY